MKTKLLLFVVLCVRLFADVTIDSGWVSTLPTTRSSSALGGQIIEQTDNVLELANSKLCKAAIYTTELAVGLQYLTAHHELGHARAVKAAGGSHRFDTGDTNFWPYLVRHPFLQTGATYWNLPASIPSASRLLIPAAGFNAEMQFAEQTHDGHLSSMLLRTPARLSSLFYSVKGELDDRAQISAYYATQGFHITTDEQTLWQAAAFLASRSTLSWVGLARNWSPEVFVYYNPEGIAVRAVLPPMTLSSVKLIVAAESTVHGRSAQELSLRATKTMREYDVTLGAVISRHAIAPSAEVSREWKNIRLTMAVAAYNPRTLSGARQSSSLQKTTVEAWMQLTVL